MRNESTYQRLDLRQIPCFVINRHEDKARRVFMAEQMQFWGFRAIFVPAISCKDYWMGAAFSHLSALRHARAKPPFMVLEDDCQFNDLFEPIIEFPSAADLLYLGVSGFGIQKPGCMSWGKHASTIWRRFDSDWLRVFNMLSQHALIYLNQTICEAIVKQTELFTTESDTRYPMDVSVASVQTKYCFLAPKVPVCRQINLNSTEISLIRDLPQNELKDDSVLLSDLVETQEDIPGLESSSKPKTFGRFPKVKQHCLVSHQYKFIYFPISKNASSSLLQFFRHNEFECEYLPVAELKAKHLQDYFKFAFLRDPLSRLVSLYQEVSMRQDLGDPTILGSEKVNNQDGITHFEKFISALETSEGDRFTQQQTQALDGLEMDFLGMVETLQSDLRKVLTRLGIEQSPELEHLRSRRSRKEQHHYQRYLLEDKAIPTQLVAQIYRLYLLDKTMVDQLRPTEVNDNEPEPIANPMCEVKLFFEGGHHHTLHLESDSPFLNRLESVVGQGRVPGNLSQNELLQLPRDGGNTALSFGSQCLLSISISGSTNSTGNDQ